VLVVISADSFDDFLGELDEADFNIPDDGFPDMVIVPPPAEIKSEMTVDPNAGGMNGNRPMPPPPVNQFSRAVPTNNNPPRQPPQQPAQQPPRPNNSNNFQGAGPAQNGNGPRPPGGQFNQPGQFNQSGQFNQNRPTPPAPANRPSPNPNPQAFMTPQRPGPNNQAGPDNAPQSASFEDSGFFSARGVKVIGGDDQAQIEVDRGRTFNPKAEAIPKTPGIDHTKSKPVSKSLQHVAPKVSEGSGDGAAPSNNKPGGPGMVPPGQQARPQPAMAGNGGPRANVNGVSGGGPRPGPVGAAGPPRPANVVNPQLDQTRRIGAPGVSSPLSNRGQFRPPTVKRAAVGADGPSSGTAPGGDMNGGNRVPLADVPANSVVGGSAGNPAGDATGRDFKRQRTS
jgi:DNA repair and recombination protein RAD52